MSFSWPYHLTNNLSQKSCHESSRSNAPGLTILKSHFTSGRESQTDFPSDFSPDGSFPGEPWPHYWHWCAHVPNLNFYFHFKWHWADLLYVSIVIRTNAHAWYYPQVTFDDGFPCSSYKFKPRKDLSSRNNMQPFCD